MMGRIGLDVAVCVAFPFTSGDTRVQVREYFRSCMTSGQYHGRHEVARARALPEVKAFLAKAFSASGK
jgi:hypothetical protein